MSCKMEQQLFESPDGELSGEGGGGGGSGRPSGSGGSGGGGGGGDRSRSRSPTGMQIHVKTPDSKTITMVVAASDTIDNVKARLQVHGYDTAGISLAKVLPGERIIGDLNFPFRESTLHLVHNSMRIFIHTTIGHAFTLYVQPEFDRIWWVKMQIMEKTGIYDDTQRLICKGRQLEEDDWALSEYQIEDGDIVKVEVDAGKGKGKGNVDASSSSGEEMHPGDLRLPETAMGASELGEQWRKRQQNEQNKACSCMGFLRLLYSNSPGFRDRSWSG